MLVFLSNGTTPTTFCQAVAHRETPSTIKWWWGDKQKTRYKRHANGVFLPGSYFVKLRWVKFYDKKFKAPCKPELYLEQKYGKNWKKLDFKNHNYFLRENKYV